MQIIGLNISQPTSTSLSYISLSLTEPAVFYFCLCPAAHISRTWHLPSNLVSWSHQLLSNVYPVCNWGGRVVMLKFKLHHSHREALHLLKLLCKNFSRVSQTHAQQREGDSRGNLPSCITWPHNIGLSHTIQNSWKVKRSRTDTIVLLDCDLHFWPDIKMIKVIYWLLPHLSTGHASHTDSAAIKHLLRAQQPLPAVPLMGKSNKKTGKKGILCSLRLRESHDNLDFRFQNIKNSRSFILCKNNRLTSPSPHFQEIYHYQSKQSGNLQQNVALPSAHSS